MVMNLGDQTSMIIQWVGVMKHLKMIETRRVTKDTTQFF